LTSPRNGKLLDQDIHGTGVTFGALALEARAAREQAYAPFSGFMVGAAALGAGGRVFRGCNVEAAAYPLTNCAERVAIQKAVSEGERRIVAVAVVGDASYLRRSTGDGGAGSTGDGGAGSAATGAERLCLFVTPCGACRQVIFEFGPDASVLLVDLEGAYHLTSARELLPGGFRLEGFSA
jgi:cytidine deaminase